MINTQLNLIGSHHILQYLLSLRITQLQSPAQRRNLHVPKIFTGYNNIVLKNGRLYIIQVIIQVNFLVSLESFAESISFFLPHELIVEYFLQNGVVLDILGPLILHQLAAKEVLLAACLGQNAGVDGLAQHFQDVLGLERTVRHVTSLVVPVGSHEELPVKVKELPAAIVVLYQQKGSFDFPSFFMTLAEHLLSGNELFEFEHASYVVE